MASTHNHVDLTKLLEKAKAEIKSGENEKKRHPKELKDVKLTSAILLDKQGIPVSETDQNNRRTVISE